ncbi:hypothetical protein NLJ89_g7066 [Agrocybe chaxingu]|uniref:tRNA nucleotidyltransferase n=1 Tax=Agrocybe chaxingu TaxID=84603 RepID=A0A9W8JXD5_9AGAR|nr:hypothetical protein NLJ89_g7066 [Agrocybe chaxingu]
MDIALSDIMGLAFAEHLDEYAKLKGVEMGTITKIEQNPDQSKHLETATFKVFGLSIDLVNLRSEEYTEGSRIPTGVTFGTPLEDALRRDITINALFYNVHRRSVEDFTGKGLDDLRNGTIRTPLPPRETFQDDPLRVLRCVRFASRFGFDMVPEVQDAVKDPIEALVSKVSRERVGDEVTKMVQGRDPLRSAQLICELKLYHSVFSVIPGEVKSNLPESLLGQVPNEALGAATILHALHAPEASELTHLHPSLLSVVSENPLVLARLYLAGLLLPYRSLTYTDSKKKTHPVVASVIRDSLKLGTQNHYLDGIPVLFAGIGVIKAGMEAHSKDPFDRTKLGLLLRNKFVHNPQTGSHWSTTLLLSLITDLVPSYNTSQDILDVYAASSVIDLYNSFIKTIVDFGLQNDVDSKPLLTGHDIVVAFNVGKPGPWVGKVLEDVVEWQLGNPAKSKDDCMEWLRGRGVDHYVTAEDRKFEPASKRPRRK